MAVWFSKVYWNAFTLWHARDEERLPYRPLEEILALQSRRVRAIVAHAYETVPYYREVMDEAGLRPGDFQRADDLAQLPILTGDQVAQTPERFLSHRYAGGRSLKLRSSGSSGRPKTIHYDPAALFLALAHGHRQRLVLGRFVGRRFRYREMNAIRPGGVGFQLHDFYDSHSWVPRQLKFKRKLLSLADPFEDNIAQINAFKPDVLRGYGSYIGTIFRRAWEQGLPLFRPKAVVYTADRMADSDRLLIETQFGLPVLSTYQATEVLHIAFQCERREAFHLNLDHVALRAVDKGGKTLGPGGTGQIVISNLTNRGTVLLNYKLGDVVTLGRSACPCGRTLPTIKRIEGRADDLIVRPRGQIVHSLAVVANLQAVPGVVQVQLVQEDLQSFLLRLVYAGGTGWEETCRGLEVALRSVLGNDIAVKIERVDAIPPDSGGKVRAVISRCLR